jgi:hypothetical protein
VSQPNQQPESDEARKALAAAIERWLFDMCPTCGEPQCADWCIDLNTQEWDE